MKPIRVSQVATMTNLGGVEKLLLDYLTFDSNSQTVKYILTTSGKEDLLKQISDAGISVFKPYRRIHYDPSAIYQMANWLRLNKIEILHSHNAYANAWGNLLALIAETPFYIAHEHGSVWWIKPPIKWLDALAYHRADRVVVNSYASAQILKQTYNLSRNKLQVIYNAIVIDKCSKATSTIRTEYDINPNHYLVGSIGRLDTPKDFFTLIDTAEIVLRTNKFVTFLLIGGGPMEDELRKYAAEKLDRRAFIMTGWRQDAVQIIRSFDIFISTSVHEAFGNVFIEAAVAEVPVIAPDIDGIPEIVFDQETGILITPTEPVHLPVSVGTTPPTSKVIRKGRIVQPKSINKMTLAETILELLENPQKRKLLGNTARNRALEKFSMERYSSELDHLYRSLIDGIKA
jgi:glycosyltransferase involved in cell wall biosynthesis